MTDHKNIARFPLYDFYADGQVVSRVHKKPRKLRPIQMGAYVGLQLLGDDGLIHKEYVHRLICEAFHGAPFNGAQCRHLNGDRSDNRAANLAWGTARDNCRDKETHGTAPNGERNPMARLTTEAVAAMRALRLSSGASYASIARRFGVSTMTAFRAITNRSWVAK